MTHSDAFPVAGPWYRLAAYMKPALVLLILRDVLGAETFDRRLTAYTRGWTLKHPAPQDFFNTFEQAAGDDLDWFWRPWFYETVVLDAAVWEVDRDSAGGFVVTVTNEGGAPAPVLAEVVLANGEKMRLQASAEELARNGFVRLRVDTEAAPASILLDPEQCYPDVDRSNDTWPGAQAERSSRSGASARGSSSATWSR